MSAGHLRGDGRGEGATGAMKVRNGKPGAGKNARLVVDPGVVGRDRMIFSGEVPSLHEEIASVALMKSAGGGAEVTGAYNGLTEEDRGLGQVRSDEAGEGKQFASQSFQPFRREKQVPRASPEDGINDEGDVRIVSQEPDCLTD